MQISDVNNNLLNMVTGQNMQKTENDSESSRFMDLLRASKDKSQQISAEDINMQMPQKEFSVQKNTTEIKVTDEKELKTTNPEQSNAKEDGRENVTADKEKTSAKDKVSPNEKKTETTQKAEAKTTETVSSENTQDAQISGEANVQADGSVELLVAPLAIAEIIPTETNENIDAVDVLMSDAPLNVENEEIINTIENVEIKNEGVENISQAVTPKVENVIAENPALETVGTQNMQDVMNPAEQKNPETEQSDFVKSEQNITPLQQDVATEDNIVQQQEEKIAEFLPDNKKVEIKVSVKEDKVVAKAENHISEDVVMLQDVENEVSVKQPEEESNQLVSDVKIKAEPDKANVQGVAVVENQPMGQAETTNNTATTPITEADNIVQSPAVALQAANDAKANTLTEMPENLKDIQNKGLTREVAEQIKVNITQSAIKGVDKIEIQLKPAELGQVEIKLHISKDGKLQAQIIASSQETLELLEKDADVLKEAFNNAGYQAEDGSFSFSHRGGEETESEKEKLRTFIGEVISKDVAEEMAANDYISADGVNIRV